jgi:predicted aspartyl protease
MVELECIRLSDDGIHILINVQVNGIEMRFVLDTGASHTVIDVEWAKGNLSENEIDRSGDPAQGIGAAVEVHKAEIAEIKIGDLFIQDRTVALIDFNAINKVYMKEGLGVVNGILGGDILNDYSALIDYSKLEIHFQPKI